MRHFFATVGVSATLLFSGCAHFFELPVAKPIEESVVEQFERTQQSRKALEASMAVQGGGFAQLLGSSTADVVAQFPNKFYVSFRTFFDTPGFVMSSDAQRLYYMRPLENGTVEFDTLSLASPRAKKLLPPIFASLNISEVLLARFLTEGMRLQSVEKLRRQSIFSLKYINPLGKRITIHYDTKKQAVVAYWLYGANASDAKLLARVRYKNFAKIDSQNQATKIEILSEVNGKQIDVSLNLTEVVLNSIRPASDYKILMP